jgi:hypothetical protein
MLPRKEEDGVAPTARLRQEIVRAGARTSRLRVIGALAGLTPMLILVLLGSLFEGGLQQPGFSLLAGVFFGAFGAGVGLAVGVPASISLFLERKQALRRRLAQLPLDQRLEVLLPLRDARGDTGRLVAPLLREFGTATELTPAASPAGRGDEVAPVSSGHDFLIP